MVRELSLVAADSAAGMVPADVGTKLLGPDHVEEIEAIRRVEVAFEMVENEDERPRETRRADVRMVGVARGMHARLAATLPDFGEQR